MQQRSISFWLLKKRTSQQNFPELARQGFQDPDFTFGKTHFHSLGGRFRKTLSGMTRHVLTSSRVINTEIVFLAAFSKIAKMPPKMPTKLLNVIRVMKIPGTFLPSLLDSFSCYRSQRVLNEIAKNVLNISEIQCTNT